MNSVNIAKENWSAIAIGSISQDLKRILKVQFKEFMYCLKDIEAGEPEIGIDVPVIKSFCHASAA